MLHTIKNIFGFGPKVNYNQLIKCGALFIDVRSIAEFNSWHIKGSLNIPLQMLLDNLAKLKRDKPVIVCCASGMRSASAKNILQSKGFAEVHNGGSWVSLQNKIS
jgi:rhodanese-related sulfurtransferase